MNLHVCAKFGPDRTTGDDVYTVGRIHTQTHTLSYIDIDDAIFFIMPIKYLIIEIGAFVFTNM